MKIYHKIKFSGKSFSAKRFYLFERCFLQKNKTWDTKKIVKKTKIWFPDNKKPEDKVPPMYLKVNRFDDYVFLSLQQWVDIAYELGADFVILCDKKELEYQILRKIYFKTPNVKFIPSDYKALHKFVQRTMANSTKLVKASVSHLTTFLHSSQNKIKSFWNIDADDTLFFLKYNYLTQALKDTMKYANEHNLNGISLDMWHSATNSYLWTFGVTYINNNIDYLTLFKSIKDKSWRNNYQNIPDIYLCCDNFLQYLSDYKGLKLKSFYIENAYFMHFATALLNYRSFICQWKDGQYISPIDLYVFKLKEFGILSIAKDCVKIDLHKTEEELLDYEWLRMGNICYFPQLQKKYETLMQKKGL